MKSNLLKISVLATVLILLSASASWADSRTTRYYNKAGNQHFRSEYDRNSGYQKPSYFNRSRYAQPRDHYKKNDDRYLAAHRVAKRTVKYRHDYPRPVHKHDHYYKYKPSCNIFSFRVPVFEPGWSVIIKSKSTW